MAVVVLLALALLSACADSATPVAPPSTPTPDMASAPDAAGADLPSVSPDQGRDVGAVAEPDEGN